MTSPLEGGPRQPISDLVLKDVSLEPRSLEGIKELPHLQRVAGLALLLLEAKSRFWEQSDIELQEKAQSELERLRQEGVTPKTKESEGTSGLWPFELLVNSDWRNLYLSLDKRDRKDLPKILSDRLKGYGDPFGFGQEVTRAILEMANDAFENQVRNSSMRTGSYASQWHPNSTNLQDVVIDMFEQGHYSGMSPFSNTEFPAGTYHKAIFPKEVAQQMQDYIKKIYN